LSVSVFLLAICSARIVRDSASWRQEVTNIVDYYNLRILADEEGSMTANVELNDAEHHKRKLFLNGQYVGLGKAIDPENLRRLEGLGEAINLENLRRLEGLGKAINPENLRRLESLGETINPENLRRLEGLGEAINPENLRRLEGLGKALNPVNLQRLEGLGKAINPENLQRLEGLDMPINPVNLRRLEGLGKAINPENLRRLESLAKALIQSNALSQSSQDNAAEYEPEPDFDLSAIVPGFNAVFMEALKYTSRSGLAKCLAPPGFEACFEWLFSPSIDRAFDLTPKPEKRSPILEYEEAQSCHRDDVPTQQEYQDMNPRRDLQFMKLFFTGVSLVAFPTAPLIGGLAGLLMSMAVTPTRVIRSNCPFKFRL
jgi:hypothetical protein